MLNRIVISAVTSSLVYTGVRFFVELAELSAKRTEARRKVEKKVEVLRWEGEGGNVA